MRVILLFVLCASCAASEVELIPKLADDDFDERERVTEALSTYPAEYAKKFIIQSYSEPEPEIAWRLRVAAKHIFERKILTQDDRWKRLHGWLGIETTNVYPTSYYSEGHAMGMGGGGQGGGGELIGLRVTWIGIDTPADCDKLSQDDVITAVNGVKACDLVESTNFGYGWETLGAKLKIKFMHFTTDDKTVPGAPCIIEEVELTPVEEPSYKVNYVSDEEIYHELYDRLNAQACWEVLSSRCRRLLTKASNRLVPLVPKIMYDTYQVGQYIRNGLISVLGGCLVSPREGSPDSGQGDKRVSVQSQAIQNTVPGPDSARSTKTTPNRLP
jgi:hypothetical protein